MLMYYFANNGYCVSCHCATDILECLQDGVTAVDCIVVVEDDSVNFDGARWVNIPSWFAYSIDTTMRDVRSRLWKLIPCYFDEGMSFDGFCHDLWQTQKNDEEMCWSLSGVLAWLILWENLEVK